MILHLKIPKISGLRPAYLVLLHKNTPPCFRSGTNKGGYSYAAFFGQTEIDENQQDLMCFDDMPAAGGKFWHF